MLDNWKAILGIVCAGMAAAGIVVWFFYIKSPTLAPSIPPDTFGTGTSRSSTSVVPSDASNGTLPTNTQDVSSTARVFRVSAGPVAGATLIDTVRPTTTVARFTMATNGHTFDLLLDSQGAVPKAVSNTTIPGISEVIWSEGGRGALLRYLDQGTLKTAHLSLPLPGATSTATRLQFLPAGISRLAVSPDGANLAYLMKTESGADGYIARADGANAQKTFSLPLSQMELLWASAGTLLAYSAPAAGAGGVAFSINASSGAATPLLSADGLSVTANRDFSRVVYQTTGASRSTYVQNTKTGLSRGLSFDPIPELCAWSLATTTALYCATPIHYVAPNYLDVFHLGASDARMSLVRYDLSAGTSALVAVPGGGEGGMQGEILGIALSSSEKYLLYIAKEDRSLWAVRLSN